MKKFLEVETVARIEKRRVNPACELLQPRMQTNCEDFQSESSTRSPYRDSPPLYTRKPLGPSTKLATTVATALQGSSVTSTPTPDITRGLLDNFRQTPMVILRLKQVLLRTGQSRSTTYNALNPSSPQYDPLYPKQIQLSPNGRAVGWLASEIDT